MSMNALWSGQQPRTRRSSNSKPPVDEVEEARRICSPTSTRPAPCQLLTGAHQHQRPPTRRRPGTRTTGFGEPPSSSSKKTPAGHLLNTPQTPHRRRRERHCHGEVGGPKAQEWLSPPPLQPHGAHQGHRSKNANRNRRGGRGDRGHLFIQCRAATPTEAPPPGDLILPCTTLGPRPEFPPPPAARAAGGGRGNSQPHRRATERKWTSPFSPLSGEIGEGKRKLRL